MNQISDAISHIRNHPEMYLQGRSEPDVKFITSVMVFTMLNKGSADVKISFEGDLCIVSSQRCWFEEWKARPSKLFSQITSMPEGGQNWFRAEVLIGAFYPNLMLIHDDKIIYSSLKDMEYDYKNYSYRNALIFKYN